MAQEYSVSDVKDFWENNPLFVGESSSAIGTKAFFEEHRKVYIADCFAGELDERLFPENIHKHNLLDLGCGPGFWSIEFADRGAKNITSADLTETAIKTAEKRAEIFGHSIEVSLQNAEEMSFPDGKFSHVNCQGVIHHTPDTEACVREISRVLEEGGSALISVYYKNILLRLWPVFRYPAKVLSRLGGGMKGRGRQEIFSTKEVDDIVRLYDGDKNPIGKSYSKKQFISLLSPYFQIDEVFYHFFPARALPIRMPKWLHSFLDKKCGFLIFARCTKLSSNLATDSLKTNTDQLN